MPVFNLFNRLLCAKAKMQINLRVRRRCSNFAASFNQKQYDGLSLVCLFGSERKVRATQSITFVNGKLRATVGLR